MKELSGAEAADVTAAFAAGTVSGSGGVNRYTATYETTADGAISISQPAATLMAGPQAAMEQEQAYFAALEKAAGFSVTSDSLTLTDEQGNVLVRYEARQPTALQGTTWEALAYNNGKQALVSLEAASSITAVFGDDGSLTGDASVNRYTTGYTTSGETMSIDAAIATTKKAGPEELMRQEAAYLAALPETATYSIEGDDLWLRDADGAALAHYVAAPD
jgi:heat shock protein HslJ